MTRRKKSIRGRRGENYSPDPEFLSTGWPGDADVDVEASDLEAWCATGDADHLVVRPRGRLALIRYRALTERELMSIGDLGGQDWLLGFVEAFRIGVVSIDGEQLRRISQKGVRKLTSQLTDELMAEVRAEVPFGLALKRWEEIYLGSPMAKDDEPEAEEDEEAEEQDEDGEAEEQDEEGGAEYVDTPMPLWLGIHILCETFLRQRRHAQ